MTSSLQDLGEVEGQHKPTYDYREIVDHIVNSVAANTRDQNLLSALYSSRHALYQFLRGGLRVTRSPTLIAAGSAFRLLSQWVLSFSPWKDVASVAPSGDEALFAEDTSHYRASFLTSGTPFFGHDDFTQIYYELARSERRFLRLLNYSHLFDRNLWRNRGRYLCLPPPVLLSRFSRSAFRAMLAAYRRLPLRQFISDILLAAQERGVEYRVIKRYVRYLLVKHIPEVLFFKKVWDNVRNVYRESPLILTGEYGPRYYPAVYFGATEGAVTIALQHGYISPYHMNYYHKYTRVSRDYESQLFIIPTYTAVQGRYYYRVLREMGFPSASVVITGQPRYDYLAHADEIFSEDAIRRKYKLPSSAHLVLWVSQTPGLSRSELLASVNLMRTFLRTVRDVHLVIKLHPLEDQGGQFYRMAFKRFNNVTVLDNSASIAELMYVSDLVALKNSTAGIESIALNKPFVLLDPAHGIGDPMYTSYGFKYVVATAKDLQYYYELFVMSSGDPLFSSKRSTFLKDHLAYFGKAARRFSRFIDSVTI